MSSIINVRLSNAKLWKDPHDSWFGESGTILCQILCSVICGRSYYKLVYWSRVIKAEEMFCPCD